MNINKSEQFLIAFGFIAFGFFFALSLTYFLILKDYYNGSWLMFGAATFGFVASFYLGKNA